MIVLNTQRQAETILSQINELYGYPDELTETFDTVHTLSNGKYAIGFPDVEIAEQLGLEDTDIDKKLLVENKLPDNFKVDETKTLKVDNISLVSKTENYIDKTITLVYTINGLKKEIVEKVNASATKSGFNVDISTILLKI